MSRNFAIIGLGDRAFKHAIDEICALPSLFHLVAGCDRDQTARRRFIERFPTTPCFAEVQKMLDWQAKAKLVIQCAYVAVPHSEYEEIIPLLIDSRIHVLREKPAALSEEEFQRFHLLADLKGVRLITACQNRYAQRLARLREWLPFVGEKRFVEGTRTINCLDLGEGWRASRILSGGGAVCDLGWHLLNTLVDLIANSILPQVSHAKLITTREHQQYDTEDSAFISLDLQTSGKQEQTTLTNCNLKISRIGAGKIDDFTITGADGTLHASGNVVDLRTPIFRLKMHENENTPNQASQTVCFHVFP